MNNAIQQLQMTDIDSRFRQTEFAINATAFEQGALNAEYKNRLEWIDDDNGLLLNICELNGVAINYEFFWAKLEGRTIVFYRAKGDIDHRSMVKKWLRETIGISNLTEPMLFHNIVLHVTNGIGLLK